MDQFYTWAWPQWVMLAILAMRFVVLLTQVFADIGTAGIAKTNADFAWLFLAIVILAAGGFWS